MDKNLFYLFFIYLVLEGALRKWLLPSFSSELFLVKDLLLIGAVFGFVGKLIVHRNSLQPVFTKNETLLLWVWVLFFLAYIPISGFSLTTIIGLRYYLIMLPVMLILPHVISDLDDLNRLSRRYLWLALVISLLGIVQFYSPPNSLVNRYAWDKAAMAVAMMGNKARITGTFSYISPYAVYLQAMFLVALAQFTMTERGKVRILLGVVAALLFINIVMTGSRAPFLISAILAVPFLFSSLKDMATRRGQFITIFAAFLVIGLFFFQFGNVFSMLTERNTMAKDSSGRITGALLTPVITLRDVDLVGAGLGSTFMGVRETSDSKETASFDEVNADRIGVEVGVFGYLFVLFFKLVFLAKSWLLYWRAADRTIKNWALVVLGYQVSLLWSIPVYNSVAAAFYFASLGLYVFLRKQSAAQDLVEGRYYARFA